MCSTPAMSKRAYGHQRRARELQREPLQLEAEHRDLDDARRHVEVEDRPAPGGRQQHHPRVGVDDDRGADRGEQRGVVEAVGVGVARGEVDAVLGGPRAHRLELAGGPHERPDERAVVGAVGVDAVAGGDDVVEAEAVGERLDEVVRASSWPARSAARRRGARRRAGRRTAGPSPPARRRRPRRRPTSPPASGPWRASPPGGRAPSTAASRRCG